MGHLSCGKCEFIERNNIRRLVKVNTAMFCVNFIKFSIRIGNNLLYLVANFHNVVIFRYWILGL